MGRRDRPISPERNGAVMTRQAEPGGAVRLRRILNATFASAHLRRLVTLHVGEHVAPQRLAYDGGMRDVAELADLGLALGPHGPGTAD